MRRSAVITWDQLKVGAVILVAIVIIGIAVLKLGQAAHLFTQRYTLVSFVPNTAGLRVGGQVTVAGQLAGSVKSIEFLPVDADTMRNLKIIIEVDKEVQQQVRRDSQAKLKTLGLLGDKVFLAASDAVLMALDARTGAERWKFKVGSGVVGNPVTYTGPDGKQYVAIYSGIGGDMGLLIAGDVAANLPYDVHERGTTLPDLARWTSWGGMLFVFSL